jgi:hypothetical protein
VRDWRERRNRREFLREDFGVRYCLNASVFASNTALLVLAQDLKLASKVNGMRATDLSQAARATAEHFAALAERHICPDWRTTRFSLGDYDRRPAFRCGADVGAH